MRGVDPAQPVEVELEQREREPGGRRPVDQAVELQAQGVLSAEPGDGVEPLALGALVEELVEVGGLKLAEEQRETPRPLDRSVTSSVSGQGLTDQSLEVGEVSRHLGGARKSGGASSTLLPGRPGGRKGQRGRPSRPR